MAGLGTLVRTASHLRVTQIVHRLARAVRRPRPDPAPAPPLRSPGPPIEGFLERPPTFLGGDRFTFLNRARDVPAAELAEPTGDLLWDYNLHYFDGLLASSPDPRKQADRVRRWLGHVPPGARPAWDAYPTSRRIVNWIKWARTPGADPPPGFHDSLAMQTRYLGGQLEYHLMANHLLANAMALTMAGLHFAGAEGRAWLRRGLDLLAAELDEQFLSDGAHFELSPAYHALVLEDLLDLIQVAHGADVTLPEVVPRTARRACRWLAAITRPDGRIPLLNDAAYGVAPEPGDLLAYAERLGITPGEPLPPGLELLEGSGYFRYLEGRLFVVGDVGQIGPSYQPGHAHCDMLSFELCWDGRPLVVDTGTSTYERGPRRMLERGTAAHNTVQVGGDEQSEIWAGFRVARRARIEEREVRGEEPGEGVVRARIRAFPPRWTRLERTWTFRGESLVIDDLVPGPAERRAKTGERSTTVARLHLHPGVEPTGSGPSWTAGGLSLRFEGATDVRAVDYEYAPEFNRRLPARALEIAFDRRLRTVIAP